MRFLLVIIGLLGQWAEPSDLGSLGGMSLPLICMRTWGQ